VRRMGTQELGGACIGLVISVAIFFITRELWCWYFKLNAMLEELKGIREELRKANEMTAARHSPTVDVWKEPR
jgi:hypothetical protein